MWRVTSAWRVRNENAGSLVRCRTRALCSSDARCAFFGLITRALDADTTMEGRVYFGHAPNMKAEGYMRLVVTHRQTLAGD